MKQNSDIFFFLLIFFFNKEVKMEELFVSVMLTVPFVQNMLTLLCQNILYPKYPLSKLSFIQIRHIIVSISIKIFTKLYKSGKRLVVV